MLLEMADEILWDIKTFQVLRTKQDHTKKNVNK